jgi:antitoxin CcdA
MRINLAHGRLEAIMLSERSPKKRAVNLFVDTELLEGARRLQINLSETLERRLRAIVKAELEKRWLEDNRAAIEAYNRRVAEHGLLSDSAGLL